VGRLTTDPTDAPSLLNRAGFTTTTVDVEDLTISYPSIWELMQDLRDMGESNAILGRRGWVSRDVLLAAEAIYKGEYTRAVASRLEREREHRCGERVDERG
jgi:NADH dehydrogenase [ubiquinone] 1 alpha subcomplex assembly factor 5